MQNWCFERLEIEAKSVPKTGVSDRGSKTVEKVSRKNRTTGPWPGVFGFLGSAFAALCCIGVSVLVSIGGALGAGFLVQDRVLIPLLAISLALVGVGLIGAYRRRHEIIPLVLGVVGGALTFVSVLNSFSTGVYLGLAMVFLATIWNLMSGIRDHRREVQSDRKRSAA